VRIYNAGLKCAARGMLNIQDAKNRHLRTIAQICRAVFSQLRHVSTIGKKLVKQQYLRTFPHIMANFGSLTAAIGWRVWGTPATFNGFHILAALLHGTRSGRQPNFAALSRECHLHLAGRPSHWASAHVLVITFFGELALRSQRKVSSVTSVCSQLMNQERILLSVL